MLLDAGRISEAQAAQHPERNKVYACLGGATRPQIEFSRKTPMQPGDVVALCTDGVWGVTPPELLAQYLAQPSTPEQFTAAAAKLMEDADNAGGINGDNLSLIAFRWEAKQHGAKPAAEARASSAPIAPPANAAELAQALAAIRHKLEAK
jgi:serine/threonine protein phosphatase PrpC